jgi:hypothetical protein
MDERRKPLISVNPLFAKNSEIPPVPNVEDLTYEHISLNLPSIAKNALRELDEDLIKEPILKDEIAEDRGVETEKETPSILTGSDEGNEEVNPSEEQVKEEESNLYSEMELNELSDADIKQILNNWEIPMEDYNRELAIKKILEAQNVEEDESENEDEDSENDDLYTEDELEELSDEEIKEILNEWGFEPLDEFDRKVAIKSILAAQEIDEDENDKNN